MEYRQGPIQIFVSYAHQDEDALGKLRQHLRALEREHLAQVWYDRDLVAGDTWRSEISEQLERADLILLILSRSFLDSDFCFEVETARAMERMQEGAARVVPVILEPCSWRIPPFDELLALPRDGEAITSWAQPDLAMCDVVKGLRRWITGDEAAIGEPADPQPEPPQPAPRPHFKTERAARLASELQEAYQQRDSLDAAKLDTTAINLRILDLKRRQRRGPQLQPGEFLGDGRFQLVHPIGQGGFATVWLAQDRETEAPVAVKVLHGQFSNSEERRERLFRGARQMAKLDHPYIVKVLAEPEVEDGWAFFVMEYLESGDFRRAVLDGRLDIEQRIDVLEKVALAIDHAHEQKIVHRDIKPANILLDAHGSPKLTDFDLVLADDSTGLTRTKAGMGSYHYAAPESMDDAATATARCDVYSLAATLVFALQGSELNSLFLIQREVYLSKLGVTEDTLEVLGRGLHWDPEKRHRSTVGLVRSLRSAMRPTPDTNLDAVSLTVDEAPKSADTPKIKRRRSRRGKTSTGDLFRTVETCDGIVPLWREIPAGKGWVGSPEDEEGRHRDEGPRHRIEVVQSFWLAAVSVTNAQYACFDERKANLDRPDHAVVEISWGEAMRFCQWLAQEQGFRGARLPTEEEWEYACRAGSSTRFWSGDDQEDLDRMGWFGSNFGGTSHAVGEKPASPWGLYDVHGNVWEWTASRWKDDYAQQTVGLTVDPRQLTENLAEPAFRATRVIRGGSFVDSAQYARSACRVSRNSRSRFWDQGFRVLLPFSPSGE